jgi:DNA-binding transcriptional MerR regulator
MDTEYLLLNDLAKLLNVQAYQIVYLLTTRQVSEPRRIGNRRVFTIWDAHRIAEKLHVPIAQEIIAKGEA